jgi:Asp-tRNA(Asn)/Glu-tRNA(Gln) amidotransferase A subunit family amidase
MSKSPLPWPTIHAAAAALRKKETTPADLVRRCLAEIDRREADIKAWVLVDRELALAQAERLGRELAAGADRGPLHGIPVGVKDIFDVADWPTAAGSKRWANSIARQDSPIVERLRHAGAIFLGKTVTTAFASFDPPVTSNPWKAGRTPGGSSSGSAAALAVGMCLGAIGSQTGGSITRPASYCGVAGCKPTYGLLPLDGIVPLAPSMDHPGPLGVCVRDLRILLQAMAGTALRAASLPSDAPLRLGRVRGLFERSAEPGVNEAMDEVVRRLQAGDVAVEEVTLPARFEHVVSRHMTVMAVEAATWHRERYARYPDDYPPKIRGLIELGLACPAPEYAACKQHQRALTEEMDAFVEFGEVSFLLAPATTGPAPAADSTGNPSFNSPWSYVGLPVVSFPTGQFVDGLPLAIQIVGPRFAEMDLLGMAERCEGIVQVK